MRDFRGNADAGVADGKDDIIAGHGAGVFLAVVVVEMRVAGLDGKRAAAGHRVPGVDHQVHDDLVHLDWIHLDLPKVFAGYQDELDVFPDERADGFLETVEALVQVQDLRFDDLPSGEGEQLADEPRGPLRGSFHGRDMAERRVLRPQQFLQEFRVHQDGREHVVVVVGHAPGQASDGFELLGLVQLFLEPRVLFLRQLPLGDVLEHPENRAGLPLHIEDGHLGGVHPDGLATLPLDGLDGVDLGDARVEHVQIVHLVDRDLVRVEGEFQIVLAHHLFRGVEMGRLREDLVASEIPALDVLPVDGLGHGIQHGSQRGLLFQEGIQPGLEQSDHFTE